MNFVYLLFSIIVIFGLSACVAAPDAVPPAAHLRPRGTTNWNSMEQWERIDYKVLKISMDVPQDRQYEEIRHTSPNWKGVPQFAMRNLSFKLHTASRGFLMEPASKVVIIVEHFSPVEWQEALSGKRGSLIVEGTDKLTFESKLNRRIEREYYRVYYRKDYKLPDGSVVIAGAEVKLTYGRPIQEVTEDDAEIRRILNSIKPL